MRRSDVSSGARRRRAAAVTLGVMVGMAPAAAAPVLADDAPPRDAVGSWTAPFEEGGNKEPRCEKVDGRWVCKPVAVSAAVLPNGKVLYWNGIESSENVKVGYLPELSPQSRDSRARLLSLTKGLPNWTVPVRNTGEATNPNIQPDRTSEDCLQQDPAGVAGVPGRPGDGLAGTVNGQVGGPATNPTCAPDDVQANDADMFCADEAQLPDGDVLVVGGTDWYNEPSLLEEAKGDQADVGVIELEGLRSARIYDWEKGSFKVAAPMKYGRWYPGLVTLSDGKVFAASGVTKLIKTTQGSQVRRTETYDPKANKWEENYTGPDSENSLPLNPRLFLTPNNKVFYDGVGQMWGPLGQAADEALFGLAQFFNPETKKWELVEGEAGVTTPRSMASSVALPMKAPYDRMSILTFGGTLGPPPGSYVAVGQSTITTVTAQGKVSRTQVGDMKTARWFPSGVALPDGKVLALNGGRQDGVLAPGTQIATKTPELFDPKTGEWTEMAVPERERTYHNSAVLLPDGRVLSGGSSPFATLYGGQHDFVHGVTANNDKDPSFEVFSPPYLFYGKRPHIQRVNAGVRYGQRFKIKTADAGRITKVVLMRMPSPQHVMDSDSRSLELPFTRRGRYLTATTPANGVAAPPGYYYLFINSRSAKGEVPSLARLVRVGGKGDVRAAPEPMKGEDIKTNGASPDPDSSYPNQPADVAGYLGVDQPNGKRR
jgi:hypothetical protein